MDDETKEEKKEKRKMMKIISADTSISYKTIVESCVDDPNKARNNFGSTFLKSNPNLTPQKLKILS